MQLMASTRKARGQSITYPLPSWRKLAMREAMQEAKCTSLLNVWFRTDSQELARAINSKSYPVELFGVLMDIELLSSSSSFVFISFIGREHNCVADSLAKSALQNHVSTLY
ncbi:hypothetical protein DY000_02027179 [Brassica cretica]|uniref:RNase H type-1 domain-containing protein n=1 Tax=Brassica cretica TaxID=69181 RepID=A0ABQ7EFW3_BRACR|nr:hypothetical protein DY000_02027179 [Brassica cretica]